jgi:hypothetical protein
MAVDRSYKFGLGDRVRDRITGFVGIVVGRSNHISGCDTMGIQPEALKDGAPQEVRWFDDLRVDLVDAGVVAPITRAAVAASGADSVPQATRSEPGRA